jgi:hypothetical protein
MHRAVAHHWPRATTPPPQPMHTGSALTVGETCLLRRPTDFYDSIVELRAIDRDRRGGDVALILIRDRFETVELSWLRRAHIMR